MSFKKKRRAMIIITVIITLILTGGAYAFVSQGPLEISGVVTADARLRVVILQNFDTQQMQSVSDYNVNKANVHFYGDVDIDAANLQSFQRGTASTGVDFSGIRFNAEGQWHQIEFTIMNVGTMPAAIYGFNNLIPQHIDGHDIIRFRQVHNRDGIILEDGLILRPGQHLSYILEFSVEVPGHDFLLPGDILQSEASFLVQLNYGFGI